MIRRRVLRTTYILLWASGLTLLLPAGPSARSDEKIQAREGAEPADPPPDPKWLQKAVNDLFGKKGNGRRPGRGKAVLPGQSSADDDSSGTNDPVDSRAPHDAKVEQLLQAADIAVRQKNWKTAVDLFQRLLDQPEDSLHRSATGQWQSVRRTANQLLGKLPEATLAEYRSQYGGLAQHQLLAARQTGATADFVNVATRFFHTPAGYEAAHYLGALHFDRSEFGLAARWFEELSTSPSSIARQDPWLMQAALASARAGDLKGANGLLGRLSQGAATVVPLGTGSIKASDWLIRADEEKSGRAVALADWTQLYGTAARIGTALGGDALLSPNWSLPLTSSHIVRNALKWLIQDLQDQQRALILAAAPLVVDGKVVYRDLRGMRSVDIERGHALWESVEGVSPERILGGLPPQQIDPQEAWRFRINPFQNMGDFQGPSADYSPLTSLLFRDGLYGLISSDGKQLFVIEDHGILSRNQPGQHWGWDGNPEPQDPYGLPWKTNRLVSYDLQTGRTLWSLGGSESRESFDLPLAGSYFYGTPAVDGEELFVVAGKGDDIRLWSLDRRTGAPRWSQLIAYADTKIDLDIARRWITSQVAVGNGVIVCPTTVGWLVAIDRMRQSVLWAHRYTPRNAATNPEREPGSQFMPQRELNALWCPSAPVIAGSYVVYTPQEEPLLICLNAVDGRRLWEHPKERGLYLAGVFDEKVVVVAENNLTAYHLADGKVAWTAAFDEGVLPSGRGVAVDERFYLPLNNGELRAVSLATGKLISQTYVASQQPPLGNLAMHRGKLVSLGPAGLTVFGQRDALLTEIQERLAADPRDAWALLRSSEIQILNHRYADALPLLRQIVPDRLTPDEKSRQHAALVESLSTVIHHDVLQHVAELDELRALATSPAEKLLLQELTAEKLLAEHDPLAAFEIFSRLADDAGNSVVVRTDDRHIAVRRSVWLSGRMLDIWSATPPAERRSIDERIASMTADAARQSEDACRRVATLFAFHPAAIDAQQQFVEWRVQANDPGGARLLLQKLADDSDRIVAAKAHERLARLMLQSQLPADAVYYYRALESRFADVMVRDGLTGAALVAQVRAAKELDFAPQLRGLLWSEAPLRLVQSVVNYTQPSQDVAHEVSLPFFDLLNLESHQSEQRLALESVATGQVNWMVPLRSTVRGVDEGHLSTRHIGHQLFFVNRGVLHAISPIDKRVLWTKSLDDQGDGIAQGRHSSRPPIMPMSSPGYDGGTQSLLQRSHWGGRLAVVQPNYLCVYGRRSLLILDPRNGDELWELDGLPTNAMVVGHRDALFAIVPGKDEALAYRACDGKPLEIPGAAKLLNNTLLTRGSSLLLLEPAGANPLLAFGFTRSKISLRLYDPLAQTTHWQLELPAGTLVSPLGEEEVVAYQGDGQLLRIDVATGKTISLEPFPAKKAGPGREIQTEKYLLADEDRIYLLANSTGNEYQSYGESLTSIRMNGTLTAWSRRDNRLLWSREIKRQNMIVDRFSTLPVLLFVSRDWKQQGRVNIGTLNVAAIHKQTGKILIESHIPSAYSGFHAISVNAEEPSLELKSYNLRLRLVPGDGAVAAEPDSKPLTPTN
jgi:outer membrane protein assembly factor BamB